MSDYGCDGACRWLCVDCGGSFIEDDEDEAPFRLQLTCAVCRGTFLDGEHHRCPPAPVTGSNLGDVGTVAAMRAREHGRDVPDGLDIRIARDRVKERAA